MANAALAYKCVEVAYMKAAFYKHPGAIEDKHALQATSLMVLPGFFRICLNSSSCIVI
jgi:hypothetical protein